MNVQCPCQLAQHTPVSALTCHTLCHLLLSDYIKHMDDAELTSLVSIIKKQRKKLKDESRYLCLEPCGSPFCELCGVQMVNSVTGEEW